MRYFIIVNEETLQKQTYKNKPSRRKYIIAAGIILLLITPVLVFIFLSQNQKPDPASEKIIRGIAAVQLNKNPNDLNDEDFATITELTIITRELSDIRILKKFINLQKLYLISIRFPEDKIPIWMNLLGKIGLISKMKVELIDFEILEKLPELHTLLLNATQIRNIKFIKGLKNLQELSLSVTQVNELKPLKGLTNLRELNISNTQVSNLEPLKGLENLKSLRMQDCPNITEQEVEVLQKALPDLEIYR